MDDLVINATKSSPSVHFDAGTGVLEIKGKSYPANAAQFFDPVFQWIEEYLGQTIAGTIEVNLEMTYLNSSSSKAFLNLFDMLDCWAGKGQSVVINWHYHEENDTMLECGEEFMEDLESVSFNLVEMVEK
jgi:hypothetical protein